MRIPAWTLAAIGFAGAAASASDDFTVTSNNTHNGAPAGTSTTYLSSTHARMDRGAGHSTILDLKSGTITTVDANKKTWSTVTKEDMAAMNAKMKAQMNTPEARRGMKAIEGMASSMAESYEVKKTGQTRKVGPYTCEEWEITMSEASTMKECVTTEVKFPEHAYDAFRKFGESMRGASPFASVAKSGESLADKMKAIKGFPVATSTTIEVMGTRSTTETEVTKVSHDPIPSSTWAVPADYAKVESPMVKAMSRGNPRG